MAIPQPIIADTTHYSPRERMLALLKNLDGLERVEALIQRKLSSEAPLLGEIGSYLLSLGGKRIRPVLTLLVAKVFGMSQPTAALIDVAAGIELIHMATLLHDDIIDKSPRRRHQDSPYLRYGTENTLLCGDFLLTRAFSLCAHLDHFIIDNTEQACIDLTEGEILEVPLYQQHHSIDSTLLIARKKTAALFRLGAVCGAHLSGAGSRVSTLMQEFGDSLGIAFQILDDVLDVTADEELLGKKSGIDLLERKPSAINVLWLHSDSPRAKRLLRKPADDEERFVSEALHELRGSKIVSDAQQLAQQYIERAEQALTGAEAIAPTIDTDALADLRSIIAFTTARNS